MSSLWELLLAWAIVCAGIVVCEVLDSVTHWVRRQRARRGSA
jgi:hypothetical protein